MHGVALAEPRIVGPHVTLDHHVCTRAPSLSRQHRHMHISCRSHCHRRKQRADVTWMAEIHQATPTKATRAYNETRMCTLAMRLTAMVTEIMCCHVSMSSLRSMCSRSPEKMGIMVRFLTHHNFCFECIDRQYIHHSYRGEGITRAGQRIWGLVGLNDFVRPVWAGPIQGQPYEIKLHLHGIPNGGQPSLLKYSKQTCIISHLKPNMWYSLHF
jgi:hypothetical protein